MNKKEFSFDIVAETDNGLGRAGVIHTPHGDIETPTFAVVGTYGEVRNISMDRLREIGAQVVLSNGYHLSKIDAEIDANGGLAERFGWKGPTITDSGGFQVMSLGSGAGKVVSMDKRDIAKENEKTAREDRLARVTDEGVYFKADEKAKEFLFTPEYSMQFQHKIGADIIMAFDELTSINDTREYNEAALKRTHEWATRCLIEHQKLTKERKNKPYQALYGVLQGAHYEDLRRETARFLGDMEFDGFGLGGAFEKEQLGDIVKWCNEELPKNKPRHLLGLSKPDDLFIGAENGVDTFDCVAPTREARHGRIYTLDGDIDLKKNKFKNDESVLYDGCECPTCLSGRTRAEIQALMKNTDSKKSAEQDATDKKLAQELTSIHNVFFIINLTKQIRESIIDGTFNEFRDDWLKRYYQNNKK